MLGAHARNVFDVINGSHGHARSTKVWASFDVVYFPKYDGVGPARMRRKHPKTLGTGNEDASSILVQYVLRPADEQGAKASRS
jgi:hypothetical protein